MSDDGDELAPGFPTNFHVENAGLVLLGPFLPKLFSELQLVEDNEFVDHDAAERAVHLLQYCADSSADTPEHKLTLNKTLCGIPLETPVKSGIGISPTEKEHVQDLLRAVVHHWYALGNSGIEALQSSFLMRSGRLENGQSGLNLQIESRAIDMLLDSLPWNHSLIHLPWMDQVLHVDWR